VVIIAGIGGGGVDGGGTGISRIVAATSETYGAGAAAGAGLEGGISADSGGVGAHEGTPVFGEPGGVSGFGPESVISSRA